MESQQKKRVLLTGTSSGHGFMTAKALASRGHAVFAGMRDAGGKNRGAAERLSAFAEGAPGSIDVLDMDVTSDEQVNAAAARVVELGGQIDVAVNSAGFVSLGWLEEFSIEQFHKIMDVFLYGAQRVYRAVLPDMRKRRSGLIINVTTIGARLAMPLRQGPYTSAKWALEALSERYHQELSSFNIESITVQPGLFPGTRLVANAQYVNNQEVSAGYPPYTEDRYYKAFNKVRERMLQDSDQGQAVADTIASLIDMPAGQRPIRNVVSSYNVIGCAEAEKMNDLFGEVQERLLSVWVQGKPGDFFKE
jgi:NAD(P)-dependent dehydrogenase (short-subunit alcohol dehydrogenase family)